MKKNRDQGLIEKQINAEANSSYPYQNLSLNDMDGEIWKDVVGFEGKYAVSNFSRIKSLSRIVPRKRGMVVCDINVKSRICKQHIGKQGYCYVVLSNVKGKLFNTHRLTAMSFIENPENKRCVNHKNGIKHDNHIDNLEWATHSENNKHSYSELGRINVCGEKSGMAKLTTIDVIEIRKLNRDDGLSYNRIAKMYGIYRGHARDICLRTSWNHVD